MAQLSPSLSSLFFHIISILSSIFAESCNHSLKSRWNYPSSYFVSQIYLYFSFSLDEQFPLQCEVMWETSHSEINVPDIPILKCLWNIAFLKCHLVFNYISTNFFSKFEKIFVFLIKMIYLVVKQYIAKACPSQLWVGWVLYVLDKNVETA